MTPQTEPERAHCAVLASDLLCPNQKGSRHSQSDSALIVSWEHAKGTASDVFGVVDERQSTNCVVEHMQQDPTWWRRLPSLQTAHTMCRQPAEPSATHSLLVFSLNHNCCHGKQRRKWTSHRVQLQLLCLKHRITQGPSLREACRHTLWVPWVSLWPRLTSDIMQAEGFQQ